MAKKWDTQEIREAIGRMRFDEERSVEEIHGFLRDPKSSGIPYKVEISKRQIYYYLDSYVKERIRSTPADATGREVAQIERRMVRRLAQEVEYLERKAIGTLTAEHSRNLNAHHKALIDIEKRAKKYAKRTPGKSTAEQPAKGETPLERMAREERERQADSTPETAAPAQSVGADQQPPEPPQATSDVERSESEPVHDNGSEHASDLPADQGTSSQVDRQGGPALPDPAVIQARRAAVASGVASGHPA